MKAEIREKLQKIVKENYEAQAADFSASRQKLFWPEIAKLAAPVKAGDRILDMGCGQGRLLEVFAGQTIDYLGIDQSESLIKAARANYPDKNFRVGDILNPAQLPEENFAYIFCIAVLHHIPGEEDRIKALRFLAGKLISGGRLIISVWNLQARGKFRLLLLKSWWQKITGRSGMDRGDIIFPWGRSGPAAAEGGVLRYYHAFTFRELKKISRAADLKIEELYKDMFNYYLVLRRQ